MSDEKRESAPRRPLAERMVDLDTAAGLPPYRQITDPRAVRALAHPTRIALMEMFSMRGGQTLTATQAAELIDESPTNCAFHLRTLAKYGFLEQAEGGKGRERPWRIAHLGFEFKPRDVTGHLASAEFARFFHQRILDRYIAFSAQRAGYPEDLREMAGSWDTVWYATPDEVAELKEQINELIMRYRERFDPGRRPAGGVPVQVSVITVPITDPHIVDAETGD
jgi:hypothetical protein